MSTGETAPLAANESITASPPVGERIELPPHTATAPVERVDPRRGRTLDGILCLLLLVLAFLCASFKARNSDLFQSLATGRLLAQGEYAFGTDPFSFASKGTWVNQSWLYDLGTYALYRVDPSGVALVALKALLVVALAWLMLRAGATPGEKLWVPMLCAAVGVLALSPRLLLQSSILSMLLLGVTIFLLLRSAERPGRLWLLPAVCLLWVNLDAWFFLGPLTVALFFAGKLVGARLGNEPASAPGEKPAPLGFVLLACLAACLCNPHHVRAFTSLPIGLAQWGGMEVFKNDDYFRWYFLSPWIDIRLYFRENIGLSVAGVSYFVLLGLSLASFACVGLYRPSAFRWSRLFVWLFFVVLSGLHIRAIPFFAIVAAPLAALNFLDLARLAGTATSNTRQVWDAWAMPGRVFALFGMVALCVASISGVVQSKPHYRREVGWGVEVDPGLAGAAKQIAAWRADGAVGAGQHWQTLSPDVANYLSWFAPGEKGFVDQRLMLFTEVGPTSIALRRSLAGNDGQGADQTPTASYRKMCRDLGVEFFVVHNSDPTRASGMLRHFYADPKEFVPAFVEGGTAIFAWRDLDAIAPKDLDKRLVLDFEQRAFGKADETAPETPTLVPAWEWWHPVVHSEAGPAPELGLSLQYSTRFDALIPKYQDDQRRVWVATTGASFVGGCMTPNGPLAGNYLSPLRMSMFASYNSRQDAGPPDALYLAIRACRRGLAKNPEDALSQLALAEAYYRLNSLTKERSRTKVQGRDGSEQSFFPHASMIRQTQIAAALQAVLKADPSKEQAQMAHYLLVTVFREPQFLESRVNHLKKFQELSKELKHLPMSPPDQFPEKMKALDADIKQMDRQLKNKLDQYEVTAGSKRDVMEKVRVAMDNGLSEKALNLLIDAKTGRSEIVTLLLGLGRIDDADQVLTPQPDQKATFDPRAFGTHPMLGLPAYEWFQVQKSAAAGDYAGADRYLAESIEAIRKEPARVDVLEQLGIVSKKALGDKIDRESFAGLLIGDLMLRQGQKAAGLPWQWGQLIGKRDQGMGYRLSVGNTLAIAQQLLLPGRIQEANLWTIRAWIALEAGSIDKARTFAREAIAIGKEVGCDPEFPDPFPSLPLAGLVEELVRARER